MKVNGVPPDITEDEVSGHFSSLLNRKVLEVRISHGNNRQKLAGRTRAAEEASWVFSSGGCRLQSERGAQTGTGNSSHPLFVSLALPRSSLPFILALLVSCCLLFVLLKPKIY